MPDGTEGRQGKRVCDVPWHHLITPQFHEIIWPQIKPYLAAGLTRDALAKHTVQDILQQIMTGQARLWVSYDQEEHQFEMAAVTQILQSPQCRECKIWVGGGRNMKRWLNEFERTLEAYARAEGCNYMTGGGRMGWARVHPDWHQVGIELAKKL